MQHKFFTSILFYTILKTLNLYPSKIYRIIIEHLFGASFKFSEKLNKDRLIVFKYYLKVLRYKVNPKFPTKNFENLIFDNSSDSKCSRKEFLSYNLGIKEIDFISYNDLCYFNSKSEKYFYIIFSIPFVVIFFIFSQFFKFRSSLALFAEYPLVISNLIFLINKSNYLKMYYFSIYERESNFFSRVIMKAKNVEVIKISSDTPLIYWNKFILCDKLLLCNYYQYDEIKSNKFYTQISNIQIIGPERSFSYLHLYNENSVTPPNTIGFYSSGFWVRDKNNAINHGFEAVNMELNVLEILKEVLIKNNFKLIIFIHPKEKKYDIESLNDHYSNILGNKINFDICNYKEDSSKLFKKIDLGVSFNSSIIHERIYCGFKSLLFKNNSDFPVKNSPFSYICAKSSQELEDLIISSLKMTTYNFFEKFNLASYSFRKIKP